MCSAASRIDKRSRRVRIDRTVLATNAEEHELGLILELNAEPVPAGLVGFQLIGEKLVVHPGKTCDVKFLAVKFDGSLCVKPSERHIVRRVACASGLLTDAIFAVNHRSFF